MTTAAQGPKALSVRQPWGWSILHAGKGIENRGRTDGVEPKNITRYRGELWLHTSKRMTMLDYQQARDFMASRFPKLEIPSYRGKTRDSWLPMGCIIGRCRAVAHIDESETVWVGNGDWQTPEQEREAERICRTLDLRWYTGGYALVLVDVEIALNLVPARGNRGIWDVPEDVEAKVRWAA